MSNDALETIEYNDYEIEIYYDQDVPSPREYDELCMLVLSHRKYSWPNESEVKFDDFNSWEGVEERLRNTYNIALIRPVFGYDHSGVVLKVGVDGLNPFPDARWDSGQAGFAVITKEKATEIMGIQDFDAKANEQLLQCVVGAVDEFSAWASGEVYAFSVLDDDGAVVDSCCGFYDYDTAISEAKASVDALPSPALSLGGK
jgi:hypothetical protein